MNKNIMLSVISAIIFVGGYFVGSYHTMNQLADNQQDSESAESAEFSVQSNKPCVICDIYDIIVHRNERRTNGPM